MGRATGCRPCALLLVGPLSAPHALPWKGGGKGTAVGVLCAGAAVLLAPEGRNGAPTAVPALAGSARPAPPADPPLTRQGDASPIQWASHVLPQGEVQFRIQSNGGESLKGNPM